MSITGDRLRALRNKAGLTQEELSSRIGIKRDRYAKYETGGSPLNQELLKMFADFFKVSTDYLLGRTDDPSPRRDVRDVLTPEVLKKHGLDGVDLYDEAEKNGLTDEEAAEILRDFGPLYKKHKSKFVENS